EAGSQMVEIDLEGCEHLPDLIVELSGDPYCLRLAGGVEILGEQSESFLGFGRFPISSGERRGHSVESPRQGRQFTTAGGLDRSGREIARAQTPSRSGERCERSKNRQVGRQEDGGDRKQGKDR